MKGNFQLIYLNQSGMNYNTRPNYNTNPKFMTCLSTRAYKYSNPNLVCCCLVSKNTHPRCILRATRKFRGVNVLPENRFCNRSPLYYNCPAESIASN